MTIPSNEEIESLARSAGQSVNFLSLLLLLFLGLKLSNIIQWSWWWVLAPIWAPIIGICVLLLLSLIIAMFGE